MADTPIAEERICPDCGVERADYEGPNGAYLPTCPHCGSRCAPALEMHTIGQLGTVVPPVTPSEALNPSPALLAALGSIAVHAEELIAELEAGNTHAAEFDAGAIQGLVTSEAVSEWLGQMKALCMLPEKRR